MAKISILEALRRGLTASKDYSDEVKDNLFVKSDTEPTNRMNQAYVKTNGITYNLAEISDLEGMVKTVNHVAPDEDGNVNVQGGDVILIAPNGDQYKLGIDNTGKLVTTLVGAPITDASFGQSNFNESYFN